MRDTLQHFRDVIRQLAVLSLLGSLKARFQEPSEVGLRRYEYQCLRSKDEFEALAKLQRVISRSFEKHFWNLDFLNFREVFVIII